MTTKVCKCESSGDHREGWVRDAKGRVWCNGCMAPVVPHSSDDGILFGSDVQATPIVGRFRDPMPFPISMIGTRLRLDVVRCSRGHESYLVTDGTMLSTPIACPYAEGFNLCGAQADAATAVRYWLDEGGAESESERIADWAETIANERREELGERYLKAVKDIADGIRRGWWKG